MAIGAEIFEWTNAIKSELRKKKSAIDAAKRTAFRGMDEREVTLRVMLGSVDVSLELRPENAYKAVVPVVKSMQTCNVQNEAYSR